MDYWFYGFFSFHGFDTLLAQAVTPEDIGWLKEAGGYGFAALGYYALVKGAKFMFHYVTKDKDKQISQLTQERNEWRDKYVESQKEQLKTYYELFKGIT